MLIIYILSRRNFNQIWNEFKRHFNVWLMSRFNISIMHVEWEPLAIVGLVVGDTSNDLLLKLNLFALC